MSFIFKLTSFILNVSKSCTLCPLCQTQLDFLVKSDSEFDWFDRNAFLERKESTKGNSKTASYSRSNSQKFSVSLKSKPAIIGLPKTQQNTHVDSNRRQCKLATVRMFPKRSASGGRTTVTEPSSPKVLCIRRVRSKRCPSRRKAAQSAKPITKPVNQTD
ncbi:putative calcium/calmodulin-dependent protein kinase [Helianthus anomalus]